MARSRHHLTLLPTIHAYISDRSFYQEMTNLKGFARKKHGLSGAAMRRKTAFTVPENPVVDGSERGHIKIQTAPVIVERAKLRRRFRIVLILILMSATLLAR